MKLKVLTTNIWRYYDWDKRKDKLTDFIKKQDSDIVFLQEVAYDERLKDKWENQLQEINEELNYLHSAFGKLMDIKFWHKEPINWIMYYGLGILSKHQILNTKLILLESVEKDKNSGFLHAKIKINDSEVDIINVHLENTDRGSKKQLKQILDWCNKKGIKPIIAGDFNIKNTEDLIEIADENFEISYKIKQYKSFEPTEFSNNKEPITLDYIIIHKNIGKIINIDCINTNATDHNPVSAIIDIR